MSRSLYWFAVVFAGVFYASVAGWALSGCLAHDPNAGKVAAAMVGQRECLRFQRDGKPDTAAWFPHRDQWWLYHPSFGSRGFPKEMLEEHAVEVLLLASIAGSSGPIAWESTSGLPEFVLLQNACLPSAIEDSRNGGGAVRHMVGHAESDRQRRRRLGL